MLLIRSIVCLLPSPSPSPTPACVCTGVIPSIYTYTYMEKLSQVSRKVKWIHSRAELVPESLLCSAA